MDLYLVRHAIAEDPDGATWPDDSKRPLSDRGVKRFRKGARGLTDFVPEVDIVLASPYERARHTALLLHEAGWPAAAPCPELAGGEPGALLRALQPYAQAGSVALVGHEPHLSRFAAALLGLPRPPWSELNRGGVLCVRLPQLGLANGAELRWLLTPRVLRALS